MTSDNQFKLKQACYDLSQILEILFRKKDIGRIPVKVPLDNIITKVEAFTDLALANKDYIISLLRKTDTLSDYTIGHSINVAMLSILIGDLMDMEGEALTSLATAALLHDIGKRNTPEEILFKGGKLSDQEFTIMKKHPIDGYTFIMQVYPNIDSSILRGIMEHHERMDGSGYPSKLKWYEISTIARIIAVADVYEAFTALRSYHEKRTISEGVKCIRTTKGLDKNIIELFTEYSIFYPPGMYVILSDQSVAVVSGGDRGTMPRVIIPGTYKTVDLNGKDIVDVLS